MPLPNTRKEELEKASEDLAQKIALEPPFISQLGKIFKQIGSDFKSEYIANRRVLDVTGYSTDFLTVLRNNYRRTTKKFSKNIRNDIKGETDEPISDEINEQINSTNNKYILNHSVQQSEFITKTTQKDLYAELDKTLLVSALRGEILTVKETADITSKNFIKRELNRAPSIASTEINNIAENTKNNEANILTEVELVPAENIRRVWNSAFLETTRLSHAAADGQMRRINESFVVQRQYLKYPGDTSLGASLANTINCYCSLTYTTRRK